MDLFSTNPNTEIDVFRTPLETREVIPKWEAIQEGRKMLPFSIKCGTELAVF